jgi:hypothetical protein
MQFLMVAVLDGSATLPMSMNSVLILAGADCFGVSLVTASRGKFAHLEHATTDANRSPGNSRTRHALLTAIQDYAAICSTPDRLCTADAGTRSRPHTRPASPPPSPTCRPRPAWRGLPCLDIIQRPQSRSATCSGLRLRPLQTDACFDMPYRDLDTSTRLRRRSNSASTDLTSSNGSHTRIR